MLAKLTIRLPFRMTEYEKLNKELREAGVPDFVIMGEVKEPIDTLVNTNTSSYPYIEILAKYLSRLSGNSQEMVVRALSEKKNKKVAPNLLSLFLKRDGLTEHHLWAVGNALYVIDDKRTYPEIINLCKDKSLGKGRAKLLGILARIRSEEAFNILVDNLSDPEVRGDAIEALGRFGDARAIEIIESISVDKREYEFKAQATALKRLKEVNAKVSANKTKKA